MWILCLIFIYILIHGAVVMGIFGGTLTPVTVMCRVTKIKENTTQKIHTHTHTHKESYYSLHIETHTSRGHKPTLLTIIQLIPGTTVIGHITLLVNYFIKHWGP